MLGFAGDTSAVDKLSNRDKTVEALRTRLAVNGEMVHPDKDEFIAAGKMREKIQRHSARDSNKW